MPTNDGRRTRMSVSATKPNRIILGKSKIAHPGGPSIPVPYRLEVSDSLNLEFNITASKAVAEYTDADLRALIGTSAAAASNKTVNVPGGTYIMSSEVWAQPGVKNLTLNFAPGTILRTAPGVKLPRVLSLGFWNYWLKTNPIRIAPVALGDFDVTISSGQPLPTIGEYYVLGDDTVCTHDNGSDNVAVRRDLVRVTSISGRVAHLEFANRPTGALMWQEGAGKAYDKNPFLATLGSPASQNVRIVGNGLVIDAGGSETGLVFGAVDGAYIEGVEVMSFNRNGLLLTGCRNSEVDALNSHGGTSALAGDGYGARVSWCRGTRIGDSSFADSRHGVVDHAGNMDMRVHATQFSKASMDTHGMESRRLQVDGCSGETGLDIGNDAWHMGVEDCLIQDCNFSYFLSLRANAKNITVRRGRYGKLILSSRNVAAARPPQGKPVSADFYDVEFVNQGKYLVECTEELDAGRKVCRFGTLRFFGGSMSLDSPTDWHTMLQANTKDAMLEGTLEFYGHTFKRTGGPAYPPFDLQPGPYGLNLTMQECIADLHGPTALIRIKDVYGSGNINLIDNHVYANGKSGVGLLWNQTTGGPSITETGTVVNV